LDLPLDYKSTKEKHPKSKTKQKLKPGWNKIEKFEEINDIKINHTKNLGFFIKPL